MAVNDAAMSDTAKEKQYFSAEYIERWKRTQLDIADHDRASAIAYARRKAIKEGALKDTIDNAISCMKNGMSIEIISKSLDLPRDILLDLTKKNNIALSDTAKAYKHFSAEYIERWKRTQLDFADHDRASAIAHAKAEAFKEGFKEGAEKQNIENAISTMRNGLSIEIISKSLGLSKEFLLDLAKKNNITVTQ